MKDRTWIYAVLLAIMVTFGYLSMKASGSDNFVRGYQFSTATGLVTGAELEDLVTRAQLAQSAFDPSNTNRLFDTESFTGKQDGATWILTIAPNGIDSDEISGNAITTDKLNTAAVSWRALDTNIQIAISNTIPQYYNMLSSNSYSSVATNGYTTNNSGVANGITTLGGNIVDVYGWSYVAGPGDRSQPTNALRAYGVTFTNLISFDISQLGYCPTTTTPVAENSFSNALLYTNYVYVHAYNTSVTGYSIRAWTAQEISLRAYYYGWRYHAKGYIFTSTNL